jgi:hypothetical protein
MKDIDWVIRNSQSIDLEELQQYKEELLATLTTEPALSEGALNALFRLDLDERDIATVQAYVPHAVQSELRCAVYALLAQHDQLPSDALEEMSTGMGEYDSRCFPYLARVAYYTRLPSSHAIVCNLVNYLLSPDPQMEINILYHLSRSLDKESLLAHAQRIQERVQHDRLRSAAIRQFIHRVNS